MTHESNRRFPARTIRSASAGVVRSWASTACVASSLSLVPCAIASDPSLAHAFGQRYELPVPVWMFLAGGAATVTLTFVVVAAFVGSGARRYARVGIDLARTGIGRTVFGAGPRLAAGGIGVAALALILVAGWFGNPDPHRNIAPTLVWIVWWIGLAYVAIFVGNLWPTLDPLRTLHARFGRQKGYRAYPQSCRGWPALAMLLAFGWIELVFPWKAVPAVLASLIAAYAVGGWIVIDRYGPSAWLTNVDPFHRVFALLGRCAPLADVAARGPVLRPPMAGLMHDDDPLAGPGDVGFIVAMLAIVLFDGLQGSSHWIAIEDAIHAIEPKLGDVGWVLVHSIGLLGTWAIFLALYWVAAALASVCSGKASAADCARHFASSLIPIAAGYLIAHSLTYFLTQGQGAIALLSDPLGRGWNLFGTAQRAIDIAIVDARTAWYIALIAIVAGHAVSVVLAHVAAERLFPTRALRALLPITILMVIYTIVSLHILSEPLVRYSGPQETII